MDKLGDAAYRLVLDARGFEQGAMLTEKASRQVKQTIRETTTPAEKLASRYDEMTEAFQKGALPAKNYERYLQALNKAAFEGSEEARRLQEEHQRSSEEMKRLSEEAKRTEEALEAKNRTTRDFRNEVTRQIPIIGRYSSAIGRIHPAAIAAGMGVAAITAGAYGLARGVSNAMRDLDEIAKAARPLGLDPAELMQLSYVAERSAGMTADAFRKGYERVIRSMSEARLEGGRTERAFQRLGFTVDELNTLSATEQLSALAEAFKAIEDPAEQAHLASVIFGRGGVEMLGVMQAGREEITRLSDRFEHITGITSISTKEIERANDAWADAKLAMGAVFTRITLDNAEQIADATEKMSETLMRLSESGAIGDIATGLTGLLGNAIELGGQGYDALTGLTDAAKEQARQVEMAQRAQRGEMVEGRMSIGPGMMIDASQLPDHIDVDVSGMGRSVVAIEAMGQAASLTEREIDGLYDSIDAFTSGLQEQVDTFGKSQQEAQLWRLEQQAARAGTEETTRALREQIQEARRLGEELQALEQAERNRAKAQDQAERARADQMRLQELGAEQQARQWESEFDEEERRQIEMIDRAMYWQQQLLTEEQRVAESVLRAHEEIDQLFEAGLLNAEEHIAALEAANSQLDRFGDPIVTEFRVVGLEAAMEGSQAAAAALAEYHGQVRAGQPGHAQQAQHRGPEAEQVGLIRNMVEVLERIRDNTGQPAVEIEERTII